MKLDKIARQIVHDISRQTPNNGDGQIPQTTKINIYNHLGLNPQTPIGQLTTDEFARLDKAATLTCQQRGMNISVKMEHPCNEQTKQDIIKEMRSDPNRPLGEFVSFLVSLANRHTQNPNNSPFFRKLPVHFFNA